MNVLDRDGGVALDVVELLRRIESHLGRIADALEAEHLTNALAVPSAPTGCAAGEHPERAHVDLGDGDYECSAARGGCGKRFIAGEWQEA